jgi:predicted alpha/beta hydrolase family esterase
MPIKAPLLEVVIVHGSGGSDSSNWFPWLTTELQKRGHSVIVPEFPRPEQQNKRRDSHAFPYLTQP